MKRVEDATAALLALLATKGGQGLMVGGQTKLATLLDCTKQTLSGAMTGTDPLSYRLARRLARLLAIPMQARARFLAIHVRAMQRPMLEVSDLPDHVLELVIESIERHRDRVDQVNAKRRGKA